MDERGVIPLAAPRWAWAPNLFTFLVIFSRLRIPEAELQHLRHLRNAGTLSGACRPAERLEVLALWARGEPQLCGRQDAHLKDLPYPAPHFAAHRDWHPCRGNHPERGRQALQGPAPCQRIFPAIQAAASPSKDRHAHRYHSGTNGVWVPWTTVSQSACSSQPAARTLLDHR